MFGLIGVFNLARNVFFRSVLPDAAPVMILAEKYLCQAAISFLVYAMLPFL